MPFISKDWRSPGELWVKTDIGWEKKKVLENCKAIKLEESSDEESMMDSSTAEQTIQPYCQITINCTREIAGFNKLDEVVKKLDFHSAVKDVRRFNYICALLDLLIGQRMTDLSGCAQKILLAMLEEVACYVTESHHNPRGFRRLLSKLRAVSAAERSACWGGPLGSQMLRDQHSNKINKIFNIAEQMQICEQDSQPHFLQLPEECIREIILRLSDHTDLISSAKSCDTMANIVNEQRIWRELTKFHFTPDQIELVLSKGDFNGDWKLVFSALKRAYGICEERQYAEMLSLCKYCRCLFWRSLGHPCIADQSPEFRARIQEAGGLTPPSPVPPSAFLKFFSL
ncbi:hypothetical protein WA026_020597 [Henosepilachna vigintioctopunctata]|uniref:F-box domain-containing protein n=1 Tax=Henosepilachna vigintioctopunctata TaxID=420089 RepID=A0AAW1V4P5_9CUCU